MNFVIKLAQLWPCGIAPKAPGTVGSFAAIVLAPFLFLPLPLSFRLLALAGLFIVGAVASGYAEQALGQKDPSQVVIDELVGQWLTLLPLGLGISQNFPGPSLAGANLVLLGLGFVLFRLFDIWKPGPVHAAENWLPGGWGIMLDDMVAGLLALLILTLLIVLGKNLS